MTKHELVKKYKYIALMTVVALVVQYFTTEQDLGAVTVNVSFQLIASWLIGFTVHAFYVKYNKSSVIKWWKAVFIFMIGASLLSYLLGLTI